MVTHPDWPTPKIPGAGEVVTGIVVIKWLMISVVFILAVIGVCKLWTRGAGGRDAASAPAPRAVQVLTREDIKQVMKEFVYLGGVEIDLEDDDRRSGLIITRRSIHLALIFT